MSASLSGRVDKIEAALAHGLNIDVSEYDDKAIVAARNAKLEQAAAKAQEIIEAAIVEATKPLSTEERIARVERVLASGASL